MNKKDNKQEKSRINIKEILQDKQKRAILILAIYFVFFVFLSISIRTSSNHNNNSNNTGLESILEKSTYAPERITLDTYEFEYKIMKDGELHTYIGKRYGEKQQFTYNNNEYFKEFDKYYKKVGENKTWEETPNPYVYSEYLNFDYLNEILTKSEYESTTTFKDDTISTNYKMYLDGNLTDYIMTLTSKNNILQKIEISMNKDSIILEFKNQDKVENFNKE